jgi:hypothetical protein
MYINIYIYIYIYIYIPFLKQTLRNLHTLLDIETMPRLFVEQTLQALPDEGMKWVKDKCEPQLIGPNN